MLVKASPYEPVYGPKTSNHFFFFSIHFLVPAQAFTHRIPDLHVHKLRAPDQVYYFTSTSHTLSFQVLKDHWHIFKLRGFCQSHVHQSTYEDYPLCDHIDCAGDFLSVPDIPHYTYSFWGF